MCKISIPEHLSEKFKLRVVYLFLNSVNLLVFSILKNNKFYVGTPARCHTHFKVNLWRFGLGLKFCGVEHIIRER
jgi:hypothetical protein